MRFPSLSENIRKWEKSLRKTGKCLLGEKRLPTLSSTVTLPPLSYLRQSINGQVSEWSNEHAWKVCVLATVPRVRIPPCPPFYSFHNLAKSLILQGFSYRDCTAFDPIAWKRVHIRVHFYNMYPNVPHRKFQLIFKAMAGLKNGTIHGLPPITSMAKE